MGQWNEAVPAVLRVVKGNETGREYTLDREELILGRLAQCDIAIDDMRVTRKHARLVATEDGYVIEDLGSRNGTYVNDTRIAGWVPLNDQDQIKIGNEVFLFRVSRVPAQLIVDETASSVRCTVSARSEETRVGSSSENKLEAVLHITQSLGQTLSLDATLASILDGLFNIFPQADRGLILLTQGDRLLPKAARYRRQRRETIAYSNTIVQQALQLRQVILSENTAKDPPMADCESVHKLALRSVICAPLLSAESEPIGVVQLDSLSEQRKFSAEDLEMCAAVAHQASMAIEYVRLHGESLKKARMEKELELAREVQQAILPKHVPVLEGYAFWAYYQACGMVGGDYYGFVALPEGRMAALLADVAGKGVPAALMMARTAAVCKAALLRHAENPAKAVAAINEEICQVEMEGTFVTLCLCVIDPALHTVTVVNAGHMPVILRRCDGTLDESAGERARGFPLGVVREGEYTACSFTLEPDDCVVLFSDGISDALSAEMQRYSVAGVRSQLRAPQPTDPALVGRGLIESVERHAGDTEQQDDISLLVFGRTG